jgi:type I restriction enzyme S subunit
MVRPGEGVNLDYLGLSVIGMQSRLSVSGVGSTGQTELGRDVIANMPVLIPPRMVQDKFSQLVAPMRRQAITLDEMNIILTRTRDLLLPRLISGELDVSNITIDAEEDNL